MTLVDMNRRHMLALAGAGLLSACQTIPAARFSSAQTEVLERLGFRDEDGRYLLGIDNALLFPFDSAELDPPKRVMLRDLASELAKVGIMSAAIEGHASSEGDAAHNLKLSKLRAEAVSVALETGGLNRARMRVLGVGALDPVASNETEEGRRQNRRVVLIVTPSDAMML